MASKAKAAHDRAEHRIGTRASANTGALEGVLLALAPLEFNERRMLLRWAAEYYGIDPTKLGYPGYTPSQP